MTSVFHQARPGEDENNEPWVYLGRYKAHYKLIHDIIFTQHLDTDKPRLISLGADRHLVGNNILNINLKILFTESKMYICIRLQ